MSACPTRAPWDSAALPLARARSGATGGSPRGGGALRGGLLPRLVRAVVDEAGLDVVPRVRAPSLAGARTLLDDHGELDDVLPALGTAPPAGDSVRLDVRSPAQRLPVLQPHA